MTKLEQFRQLFRVAFRNPRQKSPRIRTKRFGGVWVDLESIGDCLAGPFFSIHEHGECDYVFTDKENRFPGIETPDDFLEWCLALAEDYRDGVQAHSPRTQTERADQEILLEMADGMKTMSHLAHEVIAHKKP